MNNKRLLLSILSFSAIIFFYTNSCFAIAAKPAGWYAGLNVGYGKVIETVSGSTRQDNSGVAGSANIGYKFNPVLALEVGATILPNENFDNNVDAVNNFAVNGAVKLTLPFAHTGISFFGKIGGAMVHHHLRGTVANAGSHMRPAIFVGAGAGYNLTKYLEVNAQVAATSKNNGVPAMVAITGGVIYILPYDF